MSTFEQNFYAALREIAKDRHPTADIVEVTSIEEYTREYGGCPTCGPSFETNVEVYYKDSADKSRYVSISGSLGDLLSEIGEYEGWDK